MSRSMSLTRGRTGESAEFSLRRCRGIRAAWDHEQFRHFPLLVGRLWMCGSHTSSNWNHMTLASSSERSALSMRKLSVAAVIRIEGGFKYCWAFVLPLPNANKGALSHVTLDRWMSID